MATMTQLSTTFSSEEYLEKMSKYLEDIIEKLKTTRYSWKIYSILVFIWNNTKVAKDIINIKGMYGYSIRKRYKLNLSSKDMMKQTMMWKEADLVSNLFTAQIFGLRK